MGQLTDHQPKCFTVLHGKRLIDWQLEALQASGIDEIAVVRGFRGDAFQYDVEYFDNPRWSESNMLVSLGMARPWLCTNTCIVSYSDIVYGPSIIQLLVAATGDICITYDPDWLKLWSLRFEDPLSDAESFRLDQTGTVIDIGNAPVTTDEIQGQYMGLLKFTASGWKTVETHLQPINPKDLETMDMTALLRILITRGVKVHAVRVNDPWYEVDSENDLSSYSKLKELGLK